MSLNTDAYLINICCAVGWGTWKLERVTLTFMMRLLDFLSWPVPGKVTVWLQKLSNLFVSDIIPFGAFSLSSAGGEFVWVHLITKIITVEEIDLLDEYLKSAGSKTLWVTTLTSYRQIKSYTDLLINIHTHTTPSLQVHTLYMPTFNHPVGMCFSRSFEAEIFELHESSYEVLPRRSSKLLRSSDNNSKIPRIHPFLFQIVMVHMKQKTVRQIDIYVTALHDGIKMIYLGVFHCIYLWIYFDKLIFWQFSESWCS